MKDVSPDFKWNKYDALVMEKILRYAETPKAIRVFSNEHRGLSDYGYWFALGTLWVSYTGWSDLGLWKRLLASPRPKRETSLMKPSELTVFREFPECFPVYRAHRPGETDWISYTIHPKTAAKFALRRGVSEIQEYEMSKKDALCLFLRRGEFEVLSLSPAKSVRTIQVVIAEPTVNEPLTVHA